MKRLSALAGVALLSGCSLFRAPYPAPEPPEGCALVDVYEAGHPEDYVRFVNASLTPELRAQVFYHDPRTRAWQLYGGVKLKETGDVYTMKHSSRVGGGLDNLRYFAVKFSDGKCHQLTLTVARNDLTVIVGD